MSNGTERQAPFAPVPGSTQTIAAVTGSGTATTAALVIPGAPFMLIDGYVQIEIVTLANPAFIGFGANGAAAAAAATVANGYPVPANSRRVISIPAGQFVAAINTGGASSVYVTPGVGV